MGVKLDTVKEEYLLRVFKNKVLRRIFGTKEQKETVGCRKYWL